jgi:hypothetical protein
MKKILLVYSLIYCLGCKTDTNTISHYFDKKEQEQILTNIITFIYQKAPNSNNNTKFTAAFKPFYQKQLPNFKIQNYFIDKDSTHYFFVIRPVGNLPYKRGVLGRYKLTKDLMPTEFEEVVNTPHLKEELVVERGGFLFKELIKTKNLDKYIAMKHYVEWPDSRLVYNRKINEWVSRN